MDNYSQILDSQYLFSSRPEAIPVDLRPFWRLGVLLLSLRLASRGNSSSFFRIHVLSWGLLSKENFRILMSCINREINPGDIAVRLEPSVNKIVSFAYAEGLVEKPNPNKIKLSAKGIVAADLVNANEDTFVEEKKMLGELGKSLTEKVSEEILNLGGF